MPRAPRLCRSARRADATRHRRAASPYRLITGNARPGATIVTLQRRDRMGYAPFSQVLSDNSGIFRRVALQAYWDAVSAEIWGLRGTGHQAESKWNSLRRVCRVARRKPG